VVVDGRDPAFRRPTKPVGPWYDEPTATRIARATGYVFHELEPGRWRRLVASPRPLRFVEEQPLLQVIQAGHVVIAAGGGGVPVVEVGSSLRGVEAVVDKDLTAARLASLVGADLLLILTAVPRVQLRYGRPDAEELTELDVGRARSLLAGGEFPEGSMGPKVRACCEFVEAGGARAVIAALEDAVEAVFGSAGTTISAGSR
jgi:carbamate kinase